MYKTTVQGCPTNKYNGRYEHANELFKEIPYKYNY